MKNIIKLSFVVTAFPLTAGIAFAEPDYLAYGNKVHNLSEMIVSAKSCESAGMIINRNELDNIPEDLLAEAVKSGIDMQYAADLFKEEIRKAQEQAQYLLDYYQKRPEKATEYGKYWGERCIRLSKQPDTKPFIRLPDSLPSTVGQ